MVGVKPQQEAMIRMRGELGGKSRIELMNVKAWGKEELWGEVSGLTYPYEEQVTEKGGKEASMNAPLMMARYRYKEVMRD